jgi:hypothetical protein
MREDYGIVEHDATRRSLSAGEPLPTLARSTFTPPRLRAVDPGATRALPRMTIADLRLPADLVRARAAELTSFARAGGAQHSMRLWRSGYEQALISLARDACGAPESAPCESLFWEQQGNKFLVAVTFGRPSQPVYH